MCSTALLLALQLPPTPALEHELSGSIDVAWAAEHPADVALDEYGRAVAANAERVVAVGLSGYASASDLNPAQAGLRAYWSAREAASGALQWETTTEVDRAAGYDLALAPDGESVYGVGWRHLGAGDLDVLVEARSASDGALLWEAEYAGAEGARDTAGAVLVSDDGQRVYVLAGTRDTAGAQPRARLLAYEAQSGVLLWTSAAVPTTVGNFLATDLVASADGSTLYGLGRVSGNYALAFDVGTQAVRWVRQLGGLNLPQPGADGLALSPTGDRLYVAVPDAASSVFALDTNDGAPLWNASPDPWCSALVVDAGGALFGAGVGAWQGGAPALALHEFDPTSGAVLWSRAGYLSGLPFAGEPLPVGVRLSADQSALLAVGAIELEEQAEAIQLRLDRATTSVDWVAAQPAASGRGLARPALDLHAPSARSAFLERTAAGAEGADRRIQLRDAGQASPTWSAQEGSFDVDQVVLQAGVRLAQSSDGSLLVRAQETERTHTLATTTHAVDLSGLDAQSGALLWSQRLHADEERVERLVDLALDAQGARAFALTRTSEPSFLPDLALVALDANSGTELWEVNWSGSGSPLSYEEPLAVEVSPDGALVYTLAREQGLGLESELVLLCHLANSGTPLWALSWTGPSAAQIDGVHPAALALRPDGTSVYVGGTLYSGLVGSEQRAFLLNVDAITGQVLWAGEQSASPVGLPGSQAGYAALAVDGDGVVAVGTAGNLLATAEQLLASWSHGGALQWSTLTSAPASDPYLQGVDLVLDSSANRVYVAGALTGSLFGPWSGDSWISAHQRSNGQTQWGQLVDLAPRERPNALALDPAGQHLHLSAWGIDGEQEEWHVLGLWTDDGSELYRASLGSAPEQGEHAQALVLGPGGRRIHVAGTHRAQDYVVARGLLVSYELDALLARSSSVDLSLGGSQQLWLLGGAERAGQAHLILGSLAGTGPGLPLAPDVVLPLAVDLYFSLGLMQGGAPPVNNAFGQLDALGRSSASFNLPPGSPSSFAGTTANHAWIALDYLTGTITLASKAVPVALVP